MNNKIVRTRFAPSPTGFMHIGNLRTALYAYLITKSQNGKFILRIEDTDQARYVENAVEVIYKTLKSAKLNWDEGPDIGGEFGPYVQSERVKHEIYLQFAKKLEVQGDAYYCFCPNDKINETDNTSNECHCRDLSDEEVDQNLLEGKPFVIRQKIPKNKIIKYHDEVYGDLEFDTNVLDDQVLIKQDGYPTYNFANVVDDHLMGITHIVRGNEYLSSTPKYVLLYQAFNWDIPIFVHLPLINGKDLETGEVSKLSKRHGSTSFEQLIQDGYLPDAIINYIVFLGWNSKTDQEIFSLDELIKIFKISSLHKSPAIFDYQKLNDINHYYISQMTNEDFYNYSLSYIKELSNYIDWKNISSLVKPKINKFSDLYNELKFFIKADEYSLDDLLIYKKKQIDKELAMNILKEAKIILNNSTNFEDEFLQLAEKYDIKYGIVLWLVRIVLSGRKNTIIGCYEIIDNLSINEINKRIDFILGVF